MSPVGSPMKILVLLNDPPYGTERSYNGLRLADAVAKRQETVLTALAADKPKAARRSSVGPAHTRRQPRTCRPEGMRREGAVPKDNGKRRLQSPRRLTATTVDFSEVEPVELGGLDRLAATGHDEILEFVASSDDCQGVT